MCDFTSVRHCLIAAMVSLGGVILSVILDLAWVLIRVEVLLGRTLVDRHRFSLFAFRGGALDAFCKCGTSIAACASGKPS
jgi:hypothetical protein